jgi:hypothetical protein
VNTIIKFLVSFALFVIAVYIAIAVLSSLTQTPVIEKNGTFSQFDNANEKTWDPITSLLTPDPTDIVLVVIFGLVGGFIIYNKIK